MRRAPSPCGRQLGHYLLEKLQRPGGGGGDPRQRGHGYRRHLIGMHLKRVAVPVRLSLNKIGEANILCAYTRPKLIGGERARYTEED